MIKLSPDATLVFDCDDVLLAADSGTHARIKELITQNVIKDLGEDSILAKRDDHGHLIYFPQYVLYKFLQTGRNPDSPDFVRAMKNCYFGDNAESPEHYKNIKRDAALSAQLKRLRDEGVHMVILTSAPYNPHVKKVLTQMGIEEFFPRHTIHDITRMCALYDDVTLADFTDPTGDKISRWLKPRRENYLAMAVTEHLIPGANLYFEDNDVNGSRAVTAVPLSKTSVQALEKKFFLPQKDIEAFDISDRWVWINEACKKPRTGNSPPVLEAASLADALRFVEVTPAPDYVVAPLTARLAS